MQLIWHFHSARSYNSSSLVQGTHYTAENVTSAVPIPEAAAFIKVCSYRVYTHPPLGHSEHNHSQEVLSSFIINQTVKLS